MNVNAKRHYCQALLLVGVYRSNEKGEAAGTHLNLNNGLFTLASTRLLAAEVNSMVSGTFPTCIPPF